MRLCTQYVHARVCVCVCMCVYMNNVRSLGHNHHVKNDTLDIMFILVHSRLLQV